MSVLLLTCTVFLILLRNFCIFCNLYIYGLKYLIIRDGYGIQTFE